MTVGWTDDSGRTYQTPDGWMELKIDYAQGGQVFRAVAGKPIQYFVSPFNRPNFAYNLFITVEQLEGDQ